jgi:hypothetical protein
MGECKMPRYFQHRWFRINCLMVGTVAGIKKQRRITVRNSSARFDECFGASICLDGDDASSALDRAMWVVLPHEALSVLLFVLTNIRVQVPSMPRRPAKVTQGEIARVIRAAKEAGAAEVVIDEGQIRIVLSPNVPAASASPSKEDDGPVWTMSAPARKKRWSSRDATSWRDIPKRLLRP